MKKIILIIMLIMVVSVMISCNDSLVSPIESEFVLVEYVVNGDSGKVLFSCIDNNGYNVEIKDVEIPYCISYQVHRGSGEFGFSISSTNLINYNNVSIEMYYNGVLIQKNEVNEFDTNLQLSLYI